jgi:hypothetical protein
MIVSYGFVIWENRKANTFIGDHYACFLVWKIK